MGKEYRAKVFKSGNSVALRLPKELGLKDGDVMVLREEQGHFEFEPAPAKPGKIDVSGFWGKAPWLTVPPREDFDDPPRVWERKDRSDSE